METKTNTKKKRHHYLPKFVLRNFTHNGKLTDLFIIDSSSLKRNIPIAEQCYGDYFYGKTPHIEDWFGEIEGQTASILARSDVEHISDKELDVIKFYVCLQRSRTMGAAKNIDEMFNGIYDNMMKTFGQLNGISDDNLATIKAKNSQFLAIESAATIEPIMVDMKVKFLFNETSANFIISDDPVIVHNQFAEYHPKFRNAVNLGGLAVKGLQLFLPFSPKLCIAIYDAGRYEYGKVNQRVCRMGKLDVFRLNMLQALAADRCLYALPGTFTEKQLLDLAGFREKYEVDSCRVAVTPLVKKPEGGYTQLISSVAPYVRTGMKFSFTRVIDSDSYSWATEMVPPRSMHNIEVSRALKKKLVKQSSEPAGSGSSDE